ncbi:hypothetical protein [Cuspidothrix issatschenkoi]|uniref:hypothetical protein n=1 Tax=Cuspidothrix issatschenkoi TaxID=230752 RepID=UPI001FAF4570|nr:hypothetical protein [Cuspidothrix issatschenkoi]
MEARRKRRRTTLFDNFSSGSSLDAELSGLVEKIANIAISERSQLLLSLGNLSREELLQRLQNEEV